MYRSIEHVKFPKFQTRIFVEWKAPTIQLFLISEFAFGPEKLPDLSRNGPQVPERPISTNAESKFNVFVFYHSMYCLE